MLLERNDIYALVCVYKGKEYYANINTRMICFLVSDRKLFEYVNNQSVDGWVEGVDIGRIGDLFFKYKDAETSLLEKPNEISKEVLTVSKVQVCNSANYVDFSAYLKFRKKGIASYIVNIPSEIKSVYGAFCRISLIEGWLKDVKDPGLNYSDYDLTEDYEEYDGTKSLCTDCTMHACQTGCELIANALMNHIIMPHNQYVDALEDNPVLHNAESNQLQSDTEYEVKMYLKRLSIPKSLRGGNNGAIVMNANPFTLGHRRLIEYASGRVDQLFVFVVEEDASFFSFGERLSMVCQGTEDIKNVTVFRSGDFIILNKTFYDYFVKEIDNEKTVDASKDIFIFARYIVPYLNIKKRFVGEEPADRITAQYNEQMKAILPDYGCELIEIPRFQENDAVISGSMVRSAIYDKNIGFLRSMLPPSSFHYIYEHLDILWNRERQTVKKKYSICMTDRLHKVNELIETIKQKGTVIIYGIEEDTSTILKLLRSREKDNLIFVDKQAEQSKIYFMEKEVLALCELKENYLEYDILILTSKYYREIYFECINMGIDKRRIKYNPYNLYTLFAFKI